MNIQHSKTKNTLVMVGGSPLIAEIEPNRMSEGDYSFVVIGEIGFSGGLTVYRDDWDGFKALIAEIDQAWTTDELIMNDTNFNFGAALTLIKEGYRVARQGWNGKDMFLFMIKMWTYTDGKQDNYPNLPFIAMKTADNKVVPWLASQTDVLANDWMRVA